MEASFKRPRQAKTERQGRRGLGLFRNLRMYEARRLAARKLRTGADRTTKELEKARTNVARKSRERKPAWTLKALTKPWTISTKDCLNFHSREKP